MDEIRNYRLTLHERVICIRLSRTRLLAASLTYEFRWSVPGPAARKAPARILINVDLPAPFSPRSARTSAVFSAGVP